MADAKVRVRAVDETQAAFKSVERGLLGLRTSAASITRALGGVTAAFTSLGAIVGVGVFSRMAKDAIDTADNLGKLSQKVGVSVESLSALQYAAQLSGVESEQLQQALTRLNVTLGEAQRGSAETASAFAALNLDPRQFRDTESALLAIADAFAQSEDSAGKTAVAVKLFGRAGAELIPFLNQGKAGFEELRKEAERLGLIIDTKTAQAAEKFNDDITRLTSALTGLVRVLTADIVGPLSNFTQKLISGREAFGGWTAFLTQWPTLTSNAADGLREANKQLKVLEESRGTVAFKLLGDGEVRIKALQKEIKYYEDLLKVQRDIALSGRQDVRDPIDRRLEQQRQVQPKRKIEFQDEKAAKAAADAIKKANDAALKEQQRQQELRGRNAEEYSQYLLDIELKRIDETTKAEAQAAEDLQKLRAQSAEEYSQYLLDIELKRIADTTAAEKKAIEDRDKEAKDSLEKQKDLVRDLGLAFTSAFEDAVVNFKSLQDVLDGIVKDITRIAVRKGFTEPILGAIGGSIGESGGFDFKKLLGSLGGFLGFQHGGVVRGLQPFAAGGIVNTPTPALIGEGRTAEAIVPLPDGKSIPAKITGMQPAQVSVNVYGVTDTRDFLRASDQIAFATQRALSKAAQRR